MRHSTCQIITCSLRFHRLTTTKRTMSAERDPGVRTHITDGAANQTSTPTAETTAAADCVVSEVLATRSTESGLNTQCGSPMSEASKEVTDDIVKSSEIAREVLELIALLAISPDSSGRVVEEDRANCSTFDVSSGTLLLERGPKLEQHGDTSTTLEIPYLQKGLKELARVTKNRSLHVAHVDHLPLSVDRDGDGMRSLRQRVNAVVKRMSFGAPGNTSVQVQDVRQMLVSTANDVSPCNIYGVDILCMLVGHLNYVVLRPTDIPHTIIAHTQIYQFRCPICTISCPINRNPCPLRPPKRRLSIRHTPTSHLIFEHPNSFGNNSHYMKCNANTTKFPPTSHSMSKTPAVLKTSICWNKA